MNNKLIQQYGEDILCYRLRTARQKKRMQYEDFEKQLVRLYKEERSLSRQQRDLGWAPLVPPVQKGWKRFFVLRDDVARSRDAAFFEGLLGKINTFDWSHRKDFQIRGRRKGRKTYQVKGQKLLRPYEWEFNRLGFTEKERLFFDEVWDTGFYKQPVKRFAFNEPWRFVLRTRPNMIEKIRVIDAAIEARLREISSYLEISDMRGSQARLVHGSYQWHWDRTEREKEKHPFKYRPISRILDEITNEQPM